MLSYIQIHIVLQSSLIIHKWFIFILKWKLNFMADQRFWSTYQIARESKASSGFLRSPARRTRIWAYQDSRQSMTAEAADNRKKSQRPSKAFQLNPVQVRRHLGLTLIYKTWARTMIHHERLCITERPSRPHPSLKTASQERNMCMTSVAADM